MKIKVLLFTLLCLLAFSHKTFASHIVGGEFELIHVQDNRYLLKLILYSDDINITDPAAIDPAATVYIWSKGDNREITSVTLPRNTITRVKYTNPDCAIPELRTSKVVYAREITLSPEIYNDPEGYYINYERCCRNGVISNIVQPGATGEAFYIEFPAVVKDGEPFVNSSPNLFPPLSDFARLGYPFYFDFRGSDVDGDSLAYSLTTPLAGFSSPDQGNVIPVPANPAPYDKVIWAPGFNQNNMVPGSPALSISKGGILQVTPTQTGLFVFSVLVEEFRNGEKIGEVRREFQMLVYDYEGSDYPPVLKALKPSSGQFFENTITLTDADFTNFAENRCLTLEVRDQDSQSTESVTGSQEFLQFKVLPENFRGNVDDFLSVSQGMVSSTKPGLSLDLCLPLCPPVDNGPYIFNVIAYDDACAVPLTDTLRVIVDVSYGPRNVAPQTSSSLANAQMEVVNHFRDLGETISFQVTGSDPDHDRLNLRAVGDGFLLEEYGMEFSNKEGRGPLNSTFTWNPDCNNVDVRRKNMFTIFFITEDEDPCQENSSDTLTVNIGVSPPPNMAPVLELSQTRETTFVSHVDTVLTFDLLGLDPDTKDLLSLKLDSISSSDTTGAALLYEWQDVQGNSDLSSRLVISPDCNIFANGSEERSFTFYFSLQDDPCYSEKSDALELTVTFRERNVSLEDVYFINVFTPNGDEKNDYFEIKDLPQSGCYNRLENVRVVNRWGETIFETTDRNFRWDGEDYPAGTYYYHVKYTHMIHRSSLLLIRGNGSTSASNN